MLGFNKKILKNKKLYHIKGYMSLESDLYSLPNGTLYKEYTDTVIHEGEHKLNYIMNKSFYYGDLLPDEIIKPIFVVFDSRGFTGYTMNTAKGKSLEDIEKEASPYELADIQRYRCIYYKLKSIIKKVGDKIVFPNLLDLRNIYIDDLGNISLLCFDDMQIGNMQGHMDSDIEECYGPDEECTKYRDNGLFTKELDIRSLIFLYFLLVFNFNLNYFSGLPSDKRKREIQSVMLAHGVDNPKIVEKIDNLFRDDISNEYIDEFVDDLTMNYNLYYYYDLNLKKGNKKLVLK